MKNDDLQDRSLFLFHINSQFPFFKVARALESLWIYNPLDYAHWHNLRRLMTRLKCLYYSLTHFCLSDFPLLQFSKTSLNEHREIHGSRIAEAWLGEF